MKISRIRQSAGKGNKKYMNYENQLCWLAGIVDGEGCVGLYKHNRGDGTYKIAPLFTITNTDPNIINLADKIIRKIGVNIRISEKKWDDKTWNQCYIMQSENFTDVKKILEMIVDKLNGQKKAIAQMTLRFINSRLGGKPRGKYTEAENKVYVITRSMTQRGKDKKYPPPETIRKTLKEVMI